MYEKLLINGELRGALDGRTFKRLNPFNGQTASISAAATSIDAKYAVNAAKDAFEHWSKVGPHTRRQTLLRVADLIEVRAQDFVKINMAETGATTSWITFNVSTAATMIREAAALTTQISGQIIPMEKPGTLSMAIRKPVGVCLGIAPWNAAIILGVRAIAMPIACGNTAILKASELCPQTHLLIGQVFHEAGLPAGVLNVITNAPEDASSVVETLIQEPAVRRVNFTGSTGVGRIIAKLCADELKPCLLELGGKAPFIVLDDADRLCCTNRNRLPCCRMKA
ncbi:aldehyde dehydrogenase family protein [Pokkaliibacter sp. MBI-7]|uniref:aldehyde dehydrogenase family protein n=1 Tax=Pokkaliibacter sp. MBI-7 TaxID=3040600 RepID=UPI00244B8627|nr:aldehyde dehydrogenase family protein [Pokkaliibacter sp. MBI-7]MDH2435958.1 aldehyde dehydrogenase family protein [Pokkaliibacter sp. MBI-7]